MKRFILILFSACFVMTGWAEQITREQALRQAQSFFSQNGKGGPLVAAETVMSKARKRSQQVPDYYYVFNAGEDQGYVIVSGDDRTAPFWVILTMDHLMLTRFHVIWPRGCKVTQIR